MFVLNYLLFGLYTCVSMWLPCLIFLIQGPFFLLCIMILYCYCPQLVYLSVLRKSSSCRCYFWIIPEYISCIIYSTDAIQCSPKSLHVNRWGQEKDLFLQQCKFVCWFIYIFIHSTSGTLSKWKLPIVSSQRMVWLTWFMDGGYA